MKLSKNSMPDGEVNDAKGVVLINYALACTSQAKPGFEDTPRRQIMSTTRKPRWRVMSCRILSGMSAFASQVLCSELGHC